MSRSFSCGVADGQAQVVGQRVAGRERARDEAAAT